MHTVREPSHEVSSNCALHAGGASHSGGSLFREWKCQSCKFVPSLLTCLELGIFLVGGQQMSSEILNNALLFAAEANFFGGGIPLNPNVLIQDTLS